MSLSRRSFLGGLGAALLGVSGCGTSRGQTAELLSSEAPLPARFVTAFTVPPVKQPLRRTAAGTAYEIVQRPARVEILPGLTTEIMGYDGLFPGPTIRARRGEQVTVTHRNALSVPTVVHLHGGHTPADSDGYPIDLVLPESGRFPHGGPMNHGGTSTRGARDYVYPHDQNAATLWYHDHRMDFTGPQVWRGLAGFHLVTDDVEAALPLPDGDRDVPLMIMDRAFDADGSLRYPSLDPALLSQPGVGSAYASGVLGDVILVNGRPWPVMEVDAVRYRFRILNASNARRYRLELDPPPAEGPAFTQIGSDAGLLAAPIDRSAIQLAAAERFDVIVDFGRYPVGSEVTLLNTWGVGSADAVMRFRVVRAAADESSIPATLATVPLLEPGPDAPVRDWRFVQGTGSRQGRWTINGQEFDPFRMDAQPRLGEVEIWRFYADLHHPVHVHLSPFQVLHRGTGGPGDHDHGWKDTVDLRPAEMVQVAVRFTDYTGAFVLHCHNLEHEDMMMMSAFETVG